MQNTPATSSTAPRIRQAVRTANAKTAPPALPRAPLLHGLNRAVLWQLAACGTGLLLSAGQVYGGAAPFGLGLLLGCGNTYAPAAALGCLAGLLLFQPLDTALKLAGACIGALTARIVGRQLGQTGFLPGAACGVGVLLLEQGLVTLVPGGYGQPAVPRRAGRAGGAGHPQAPHRHPARGLPVGRHGRRLFAARCPAGVCTGAGGGGVLHFVLCLRGQPGAHPPHGLLCWPWP